MNLLDLVDISNYRSSNYMSSTVVLFFYLNSFMTEAVII